MSIELVARVLNSAVPGGPTTKLVLVGLANHAGADGSHAFPSKSRLATYAQCDKRTVQRHLGTLREAGLIEVVRKATETLPTEYRVRGDKLSPLTSDAEGGDTSDHNMHALVSLTVSEPSEEPSTTSAKHDPSSAWLAIRGLTDLQNHQIRKLQERDERWSKVRPSFWVKTQRRFGAVFTMALQRLTESNVDVTTPEGLVLATCVNLEAEQGLAK